MIFGNDAPKFIYDPSGSPVTVLLDFAIIEKDEPEEDIVIHQSVFTGHREYIIKGKYWIVELTLHLYKHGVDAKTYYNTIKTYEGKNVRYYRHRDGDYLRDKNGNGITMFIDRIVESNYKTTDYPDILQLRLKSNNYVDIAQGI